MKRFRILKNHLILAILLISFSCNAQVKDCEVAELDNELIKRGEEDQAVREEVIPVAMEYQKTGKGAFKMIRLVAKQNRVDKKNQKFVAKMIEKCGWPNELSSESHNAIYLIIQHSDLEFIDKYIGQVKEKAIAGLLDKDDYATMLDRKLMYEGKAQLFGTQTFQAEDKVNLVWPIADVENLAARRDSVSLPSMEEYFALAKKEYDVDMRWDKSLSLEEAKEMKE
ncbi:hypothetical protein GCM10023115_38830 [Pontixanthobacter gangjinensis]|uniref:HEAT repeat domain-containing protein n=1 Tax=Christiangramia aestuarii TaxID=1028746 RepID=A0A7M3SWK0_9FLAO|nr:DUF6624 domain-containing protein [Christiangramia aestuarii]MUP40981.1 hypothetical protein [Christiangramia aestuarii]